MYGENKFRIKNEEERNSLPQTLASAVFRESQSSLFF
jgi:hypothetical protein